MRSFHAFSWKLVYPAGLDSHASPCRIELRERWRTAMCVYEKMCIDFFFLIKEHKASKNNCSSLQHFTLHTKAQPPLPQGAERRFAQDNTTAPFWPHLASLCSSHFPLWLVFLICFEEEKAFSLIYLLSRSAQRINELMLIKCTASQGELWINTRCGCSSKASSQECNDPTLDTDTPFLGFLFITKSNNKRSNQVYDPLLMYK